MLIEIKALKAAPHQLAYVSQLSKDPYPAQVASKGRFGLVLHARRLWQGALRCGEVCFSVLPSSTCLIPRHATRDTHVESTYVEDQVLKLAPLI